MKYILLKAGKHGLGNKLLTLSTAIAVCRRTGAKLVVDWKRKGHSGADFWDFFRLEGCQDILAGNQEAASLNGLPSTQWAWRGKYDQDTESARGHYLSSNAFIVGDLQNYPAVSGLSSVFRGEEQQDVLVLCGYTKIGQQPSLLMEHLRFASEVGLRLSADCQALLSDEPQAEHVGLHIRAACRHFMRPDYGRIAAFVKARPERRLVLATDSEEQEKKINAILPGRVISAPKHFPGIPNENSDTGELLGLHYICFDAKHGMSAEGVTAAEVMYQSLLDWCVLARCGRVFYQPLSTFSDLILYFGSSKPWKAAPHCAATPRERSAGFWRACLRYWYKPRLMFAVGSSSPGCGHQPSQLSAMPSATHQS